MGQILQKKKKSFKDREMAQLLEPLLHSHEDRAQFPRTHVSMEELPVTPVFGGRFRRIHASLCQMALASHPSQIGEVWRQRKTMSKIKIKNKK